MTAESASRYAIEAIRFHKQEPIEELTRFASQAVEDYKDKLAKKSELDQFLEVNQKLVYTETEKRLFDYKDKLKAALDKSGGSYPLANKDLFFELIDSIK